VAGELLIRPVAGHVTLLHLSPGIAQLSWWSLILKAFAPDSILARDKMLRTTEVRVLDVAVACGFKTQQHFARVFRHVCGVSLGGTARNRRTTEYRQELGAPDPSDQQRTTNQRAGLTSLLQ
jgi:methylphosphotriester-DNA--protein-cysteine methyltransferase